MNETNFEPQTYLGLALMIVEAHEKNKLMQRRRNSMHAWMDVDLNSGNMLVLDLYYEYRLVDKKVTRRVNFRLDASGVVHVSPSESNFNVTLDFLNGKLVDAKVLS